MDLFSYDLISWHALTCLGINLLIGSRHGVRNNPQTRGVIQAILLPAMSTGKPSTVQTTSKWRVACYSQSSIRADDFDLVPGAQLHSSGKFHIGRTGFRFVRTATSFRATIVAKFVQAFGAPKAQEDQEDPDQQSLVSFPDMG